VSKTISLRNAKRVDGIIGAASFRLTPDQIMEIEPNRRSASHGSLLRFESDATTHRTPKASAKQNASAQSFARSALECGASWHRFWD